MVVVKERIHKKAVGRKTVRKKERGREIRDLARGRTGSAEERERKGENKCDRKPFQLRPN